MLNKISFAGLKGLNSVENKKNLQLLNKVYGDNFIESAEKVFGEINEVSGDKDVFLNTALKEGFANDFMHFSILDEGQQVIASSKFKMGSKPEKYGNTPGMRKALMSLGESFARNFVSTEDSSRLSHLIDTYS